MYLFSCLGCETVEWWKTKSETRDHCVKCFIFVLLSLGGCLWPSRCPSRSLCLVLCFCLSGSRMRRVQFCAAALRCVQFVYGALTKRRLAVTAADGERARRGRLRLQLRLWLWLRRKSRKCVRASIAALVYTDFPVKWLGKCSRARVAMGATGAGTAERTSWRRDTNLDTDTAGSAPGPRYGPQARHGAARTLAIWRHYIRIKQRQIATDGKCNHTHTHLHAHTLAHTQKLLI